MAGPGLRQVAGRIAGAAVLGAIVAAGVVGIWHISLQAERTSCTNPAGICPGPAFGGLIAGAAAVVIGTLAGFAMLRIRPLAASVPAGIIIACLTVRGVVAAVPGGGPPLVWALTPVLAVGFALVTSAVLCTGRAQITVLCVLAVFIVTGLFVPKRIHDAVQSNQQRARLEALPFPMELPTAAGYKIADAYPARGILWVAMVPDSAQRDRWGAYDNIAITVTIGWADAPSGAAFECLQPTAPASSACRAIGPAMWVSQKLGQTTVIARHRDLVVTACTTTPDVPASALEQAATTLHPATASQIQALR